MLQALGILSALVALSGSIPYIRDILRHKTKPHRITWLIFSILAAISFFSQAAKGASHSLWLPGVLTFDLFILFLFSLKYGVGGFTKSDKIALLIAAVGLAAWYFTNEAALALYAVVIVNVTGAYLTIEKAYKHPSSETLSSWILSTIAGFLAMLSVGSFNFILLLYPFTIFLMDGLVIAATLLGRNAKNR